MSWYTLKFPATPQFPRELCLKETDNVLFAWLYLNSSTTSTVYASAPKNECRMDRFGHRYALWLNTTCFELGAEEFAQVQALLDGCTFPTARSPLGPERAKVASTAVDPLSSASQEPPTSAVSDVGVLGDAS